MKLKLCSILLCLTGTSQLCFSLAIYPDQKVLDSDDLVFEKIRVLLKQADIIDQVIDDFKPSCFVAPFYGRKHHHPVAFGNIFKTKKTKKIPSVTITCPHHKKTDGLTLILTDPDAPSRDDPKWAEMCHFIGIVPTSDKHSLKHLSLSAQDFKDVIEYKPPGPPPKTGFHRYVFLLLEGDNTNLTAPDDRQHWGFGKPKRGVRDWAEREGLKVIGANFFVEQNKQQ